MKRKIQLTESELINVIKRIINEQMDMQFASDSVNKNVKQNLKTKINKDLLNRIFKKIGFILGSQSGYSFWAHKETKGPIQDKKTGKFYWNYEAYIPSQPGNELWVGKRRDNGKGGTESDYMIFNLSDKDGANRNRIKYFKNGKQYKNIDMTYVALATQLEYLISEFIK